MAKPPNYKAGARQISRVSNVCYKKKCCILDNPLVNTSALIVHIKVIIDNADGIVTIPSSINHKSF